MYNPLNKSSIATTILGLSLVVFAATGCSNGGKKEDAKEVGSKPSAINNKSAILAGQLDPVCEMEKDTTWTDFHVVDGDTVWFCSETCKTVFVGNPSRYIK